MPLPNEFLITVLALEASVAVGMGYLTWTRRKQTEAAWPLFIILCLIAIWQTITALHFSADTLAGKVFWYRLGWLSEIWLTVPWFWFGFLFTGSTERMSRRRYALVIAPVVAFSIAALVNPNGLYFKGFALTGMETTRLTVQHGPLFWLTIVYAYSLIAVAMGLIFEEYLTSPAYRRPVGVLLLGVIIPWSASVVQFTPYTSPLSPTVYIVLALPITWYVAIFHLEALGVLPIARDQVLEDMQEGVLVADRTGRIIDVNPRARALLNIDDGFHDTAIDAVLTDIFGEDDAPADIETWLEETNGRHETSLTTNGERHYIDVRGQRLESTESSGVTYVGYLLLLRDVTQMHERELELQRRNEQLDQFASVVSHDLRNPLTIAQGYLDVARSTEDADDSFDRIEDALSRMEQIIDDVLTLAREGRRIAETEPVDLPDLVTTAWDTVDTGSATLELEFADETLVADESRLRQLFENLFRNSIEHTGGDVTVWVGASEDGFFVADDGPGIPPEERELIFNAEHTSGGTGLGLAIAEQVADAHDWDISVTESRADGARFEVTGIDFVNEVRTPSKERPTSQSGLSG